jgi:hypothetical protein
MLLLDQGIEPNARSEPPRPARHPQTTKLPLARSALLRCSARSRVIEVFPSLPRTST